MAVTDKTTKTMDIATPGSTMPDESSRPVLITHRSRVQDPTLVSSTETVDKQEADSAEAPKKTEPSPSTHGDRVIQPLQEKPNKSQPTDTKTEATQTIAETKDAVEEAVIDAVVSQANTGHSKIDEKQNQQEEVRQENIQKLIASKQYFLPVGQTAERRNRRATMALVFILLAGAGGAYAALDSQLISNNLQLPYQFFKEKTESVTDSAVPVAVQKSPRYTTYTSEVSGFSFQYPATWKIGAGSTNETKKENIPLEFHELSDLKPKVTVYFSRNPEPSETTTILRVVPQEKVEKIQYTESKSLTGKPIYLRELIYSVKSTRVPTRYFINLSLTDKKMELKPGDIAPVYAEDLTVIQNKLPVRVNFTVIIFSTQGVSFTNVGSIEQLQNETMYKEAKQILLSAKFNS